MLPTAPVALDALQARLHRARRRAAALAAATGLLWGAAASAVVIAGVGLVARDWLAGASAPWALLAITVGVVASMSAGVRARSAWANEQAWARRADAAFDLSERTATALDVAARGPRNDVERALLRDAEAHADRVDVARLAPRPRPIAAVACAVAAATATWVWTWTPAPAPTPGATPVEPGLDLARTADVAQRVADLIAASADEDDSYVRAVGRAFEDLSERLADGTATSADAARDLAGLLGHLSRAAADGGDPVLEALLAAFDEAASGAVDAPLEAATASVLPDLPPGASVPSANGPTPDDAEGAASSASASDGASASTPPSVSDAAAALDAVLDELERRVRARPDVASGEAASSVEQAFGYVTADPELEAALEERRRLFDAIAARDGAAAAGAATESTDAAGDLAGEGSRSLTEGQEGSSFEGQDVGLEQVALPESLRAGGGRTTVEVVPDTVRQAVAEPEDVAVAPWERQAQVADGDERLGVAFRDVVRTYFLPDAAASAAAAQAP